MEFKLSHHASKRIQQRRIKPEWIRSALTTPDQLESDDEDATVLHALLEIPEKGFKRLESSIMKRLNPLRLLPHILNEVNQ